MDSPIERKKESGAVANLGAGWKRGLPPGKVYDGMVDDYEVAFTVMGPTWHRRRTPEAAAAHKAERLARGDSQETNARR